jgi:hypothetical protein
MSLRFGFLPARLGCTAGNGPALLRLQFEGSSFAPFLPAELSEFDRRRVFPVRLMLWQFGFTRGHVHDELRELIDVSGAFAFWHSYSMPCLDGLCYHPPALL